MDKSKLLECYQASESNFLKEWFQLLSFESISTDRKYNQSCLDCADWLAKHLKGIGLQSKIIETPGKPLVFAERLGQEGKPTVLFYGHYDVQPVDPLELWDSPPFAPVIREGKVFARGAEDNKGQLFYFLKAVQVLIKENALDCNLKILLEGEEETGSAGIAAVLPTLKGLLKADVLMVCDTGTLSSKFATITMGLRGLVNLEVELSGPLRDLHSGVHGGVVKNPATELARLISTLHYDNGTIAVAGFYDEVLPLSEEDIRLANLVPYDSLAYERAIGVPPVGGEKGRSVAERRGLRPTIEINGICGGYIGEGSKTIIPSKAFAKISCRLVAGQDPEKILGLVMEHLKSHAPEGLSLNFPKQGVAGPAVSVSSKSAAVQKARLVLNELFNLETALMWEGASIPIVTELALTAGAEPLLVGFGLEEDNIHAPNENFSLEQFRNGFLYVGLLLAALGDGKKS